MTHSHYQKMRAAIAYYMIILYFTVMFKPLIPVVKDVVSHTFAEAIHIATVHAIYGSNHRQKEIDNNEADNSRHQSTTNGEDQVQIHIPTIACVYNFYSTTFLKSFSSFKYYSLLAGHIIKFSPPPKFC